MSIEENEDIAMEEIPLPTSDGMQNAGKTYDYYKKVINDQSIIGLTYTGIQKEYNAGTIKSGKAKQLVNKLDTFMSAGKDLLEIEKYVNDPNKLKDPYDPQDRRRVEIAYSRNNIDASNPINHAAVLNRMQQYSGIVPKQMRHQIEAMILSGQPIQQLQSAQLLRDMQIANPNVKNSANFASDAFNRANYINLLNHKGVNLEQLISKVDALMKPINPETQKGYNTEARETLRQKYPNSTDLRSTISGSKVGGSSIEAESVYRQTYMDLYRGDHDVAHQLALQNVEDKFSVTRFGQRQKDVMQTTPESIASKYNSKTPAAYVALDLENFLKPYNLKVVDPDIVNKYWYGNRDQTHKGEAFLTEDNRTQLDGSFVVNQIDDVTKLPIPVLGKNDKILRYSVSNLDKFAPIFAEYQKQRIEEQKAVREDEAFKQQQNPNIGAVFTRTPYGTD